MIKKQPTK